VACPPACLLPAIEIGTRGGGRTMLVPHWGGHLMNVYTQDYAWPKHVLDYVRRECLKPGGYDGLMMDCLWQYEPDQQDVNADGVHDQRDTQTWQEGMLFLLAPICASSSRTRFSPATAAGPGRTTVPTSNLPMDACTRTPWETNSAVWSGRTCGTGTAAQWTRSKGVSHSI